jgi:hypothetical protein
VTGVGWLMPLLLRHIDSYSLTCAFKTFLRAAAEDNGAGEEGTDDDDDDDENSDMIRLAGYGSEADLGDLDGWTAAGELFEKDSTHLTHANLTILLQKHL